MNNSPERASTSIRVVIVDDHGVIRAGVQRLIDEQHDMTFVGQAADARSALEVIEIKRPDIVILDITLGKDNALDTLPTMLMKSPTSRVLILSMHDDTQHVQDAFSAGALGYLLKDAAESELIEAIHTLHRGERYVHPCLGARLAQAALDGPSDPLSDREREVARLLALGFTNHEVAKQLFLSVRTVETHRAHIMAKLRLDTRADLVRWTLEHDLIGPDSRSSL